ncbi:MAG: ACT domain-containing protein [Pseudobdellovibrionaceae bacterium]
MNNKYSNLKLDLLKDEYQYTLFNRHIDIKAAIDNLQTSNLPVGIFISQDEFSMIAPTNISPLQNVEKTEGHWSCFRIIGDMPFGSVQGLISTISNTLFEMNIGICVVSTFKSDWFFIRSKYIDNAILALQNAGWKIEK